MNIVTIPRTIKGLPKTKVAISGVKEPLKPRTMVVNMEYIMKAIKYENIIAGFIFAFSLFKIFFISGTMEKAM